MKSPFKFLDSYTKDDLEIFFGRDREIEELYQRVFESKLLLVYGISGTGKSSLIHCGLANKFLETDWLPIIIRRGSNIIESIEAGIKAASITPLQNKLSTPVGFKKGVRSLYLDHYKPVFFIFDQFEELFIFGDKDERKAFIEIVKSLIESDLQCRFIFVMREEYMAGVTEFEKYISTFFSNRVRIEKMSHLNALEAIIQPCKVFNISLEDGFAEELLEKLSPGSTEIELTYLQVFLDKIFRLAADENGSEKDQTQISFTKALLYKTGNISDLLGGFLDDQIAKMDDPETAMIVLKAFVSGKGTKRPASEIETIENVHSLGKEISPELTTDLIQTFVRLRVLRDKDDNGRYELVHDSLAEKVFEKFSTSEKELLEIKQFIENSYQTYLKRKVLLNNDDLIFISNKDSFINLNTDLIRFISDSRKLHHAKIRTVRRLTGISALIFVIVIGILAYFVSNKLKVINANYSAINSLSDNINLNDKLFFAREAWKNYNGVLPKEALLKAFNSILNCKTKDSSININTLKYKISFDPAPSAIKYAECSADNKYIFGYSDSLILLWDLKGKLIKTIKSGNPVISINMSIDSRYLGVVTIDSVLRVWDLPVMSDFSYKVNLNKLNTRQIFKFIGKDSIIVLSKEHDAVLMDCQGMIIQTFDKHSGIVNSVDISGDKNFILTASSDKTIVIWYFNSVIRKYDYYNTLTWHRDTVWSARFSRNSISVITSSADSTIRTGNINNEVTDFNEFPANHRYCYAELSNSEMGIIGTAYEYKNGEPKKTFVASHAENPTFNQYKTDTRLIHELNGIYFDSFIFSPDENYFVYNQDNKSYLADTRLVFSSFRGAIHNLLDLEGDKFFFTSRTEFVISVQGNRLTTYFVNVDEIAAPGSTTKD